MIVHGPNGIHNNNSNIIIVLVRIIITILLARIINFSCHIVQSRGLTHHSATSVTVGNATKLVTN